MKLESSFWHTQVTQVQNERFRSTVWNRIAVLDSSFPFALPSGTSLVPPFYLYSLSQPRNHHSCRCLSISCTPLHPHLPTSAFRLLPPVPPACYNQLGFLKTELLPFTPSAPTLLVCVHCWHGLIRIFIVGVHSLAKPQRFVSTGQQFDKHVLLCTRHWTRCKNFWAWFFTTLLFIYYILKKNLFYLSKRVDSGLFSKFSGCVSLMISALRSLYSWVIPQHSRLWISHHWTPSSLSDDPRTWLGLCHKAYIHRASLVVSSGTITMCSTPQVSAPLKAEGTDNPHSAHVLFLVNHFSASMSIL